MYVDWREQRPEELVGRGDRGADRNAFASTKVRESMSERSQNRNEPLATGVQPANEEGFPDHRSQAPGRTDVMCCALLCSAHSLLQSLEQVVGRSGGAAARTGAGAAVPAKKPKKKAKGGVFDR